MHGEGGRDEDLPHLIYNTNMTQLNFVLDKYTPAFANSRFALEVAVISNSSVHDDLPDEMSIEETKSIDDEYSPGVFKVRLQFKKGLKNVHLKQYNALICTKCLY